jgi:alkanesulfonate monooxygenase SsuD/methylene tetrahydromethanopterin reductase-like flavin-dependent oxidoreductase (luciferase family)
MSSYLISSGATLNARSSAQRGSQVPEKPDFYLVTPRMPLQEPGMSNEITALTVYAEELGFDRVWIIETNDRDAFAVATEMALAAKRITIGTNIVSVFTRTPTLLAMGAFTLDEISNGRFILGIGPGGTEIVRDGHGVPFGKPLARVNESIDVIRALLPGERVTYEGTQFKIKDGFRLRAGARDPNLPIYISALNPKMLELAGEKADGVILSHAPVEAVSAIRDRVAAGAGRGSRRPDDIEICVNLPVGVDEPEGILSLRKAVAWHLAAPTYDWLISHTRYSDRVAEIRALWWSGDPGDREPAASLVDDEMLLTFGLGYTGEMISARIDAYLEQGITPIIDSHGIRKQFEKEDTLRIMKVAIQGRG